MGRPTLFLTVVIIIILAMTFVIAYTEGKTLWDMLELLVIPLVLALGAIFFNWSQKAYELRIAEEARKEDREITADRQRETALQNYLDRMAELLLREKLLDKKNNMEDPALDVAKVRTITAIRTLDKDRRNILFQFLRDAKLADFILTDISLNKADLSGAYLSEVNIRGTKLIEADLSGAILSFANLSQADLWAANLSNAHFVRANLSEANLTETNLVKADLWAANLSKAMVFKANLSDADLHEAELSEAHLGESNLSMANLTKANLTGAILIGTNLKGAKYTDEQLAKAKSLEGAIMRDGTVHE